MNQNELRLECLRLAKDRGGDTTEVIRRARDYSDFVAYQAAGSPAPIEAKLLTRDFLAGFSYGVIAITLLAVMLSVLGGR